LIHIENKIEEIEALLDTFSEERSDEQKTEILDILKSEFLSMNNEMFALKKRLITPDISYDSLVSQVVEIMKATFIDYDQSLFQKVTELLLDPQSTMDSVDGEIRLISVQLIQSISEDSVWYLANTTQHPKGKDLSDSEFLIESVIESAKRVCKEYLIEIEQLDHSFEDLKSMAMQFVNSNNIDKDTIYEWLEKKLLDNPQLDRVTLGIVSNMVSSVLENISSKNIDTIYQNELFSPENSLFIPEGYSFNDGSDAEEVVIETLKKYLFFTIINQEL